MRSLVERFVIRIQTIMTEEQKNLENSDKTVKKVVRAKDKLRRQVSRGRAYVQSTYNNTLVTVTDTNGEVLAWSSAGHLGFKGPKKATPYAATQIVRDLTQKIQPYGLRELFIFVRG
ncbi:MAG: 30S ribosomal protein S11 [Parcubacteria group bacterium GW2011_GWC2_45_7]|nr:MAG: 30S ribosomal protein S11 [Parcubacteria group bacterium GW2011_GWC2_45_7]